jgi:hypothetical protein
MLDHVFTDAISALREAFETALLERQAFEEHFQSDILLGDLTWETSYGLPGEGMPPRVVAHVTLDWPTWSQTSYRRWYVDEVFEEPPAIELEIVFRAQRLVYVPDPAWFLKILPPSSPAIGSEPMDRAAPTVELQYPDDDVEAVSHAIEITYEGLYELAEETLADGSSTLLDDHFGALGAWISSMLVRLGDLKLDYLPAEVDEE